MSIEIQQRRVEMLFNWLMNYIPGKMEGYERNIENQRREGLLGYLGALGSQQHLNFLKEVVRERNNLIAQAGEYRETELVLMEQHLILALAEAGYLQEHPRLYDELMNATENVPRELYVEFKELLKAEGLAVLEENASAIEELRRQYRSGNNIALWEEAKAARDERERLEAERLSLVNELLLMSGTGPFEDQNRKNEELKAKVREIAELETSIPILTVIPKNTSVQVLMTDERVRAKVDEVFVKILEANETVRDAFIRGDIAAYKINSLVGKVLAKKQYSDYELQLIGEGIAKEQQVDRIVSVVLAGLGITLAVASFFVGGTLLGIALKAGMAIGGTAVGLIDAGRELAESNERKKLVYAGLYGTELTDEGLHEVDVGLMASILLFGVELFSILDAVDAFRALNKMGELNKVSPSAVETLVNMPDRVDLLNTRNVDELARMGEVVENGITSSGRFFTKGDIIPEELISKYPKPEQTWTPEKWFEQGGSIDINENGVWTYINVSGQSVSYPNGYPDFSSYYHPDVPPVTINVSVPSNRPLDNKLANEAAGLNMNSNPLVLNIRRSPKGYTWHHMEDGKTMILVDEKIHAEFLHRGGVSIANE